MSILKSLENDMLGGTANVVPIMDAANGQVLRYLIRSKPAIDIIAGAEKDDYEIVFFGQHAQICSELVHFGYTGPIALEAPLSVVYDCIELYRSMAYMLLQNKISLKLHIIMTDEIQDYAKENLLIELGELVALGVELILDNITTQDQLEIAAMILEVVEEVRMDLSDKNALSYTHLSALFSTDMAKGKRLGVILSEDEALPTFSSTYQKN